MRPDGPPGHKDRVAVFRLIACPTARYLLCRELREGQQNGHTPCKPPAAHDRWLPVSGWAVSGVHSMPAVGDECCRPARVSTVVSHCFLAEATPPWECLQSGPYAHAAGVFPAKPGDCSLVKSTRAGVCCDQPPFECVRSATILLTRALGRLECREGVK